MNKTALIVAGGSGMRMQTSVPKQFLLLNGKPILMRTLECFAEYEIILILPKAHIPYWNTLCRQYDFPIEHTIVAGGSTRAESVFLGLQHVPDDSFVAIHDGVRPLVSNTMINRGFSLAQKTGNAIPVVQLTDSIRKVENGRSVSVDRTQYRLVQTPQIFISGEIKNAYRSCQADMFTDDASVFEACGKQLYFYDGEHTNIKITRPSDLCIAEAIFRNADKNIYD